MITPFYLVSDEEIAPPLFIDLDLYLSRSERSTKKECEIMIHNPGGCFSTGLACYDRISHSRSHVTASVWGECCSAATMILQAADTRRMSANSLLMIHYGSVEFRGEWTTVKAEADQHSVMLTKMEDILLSKSKLTRKKVRDMLKTDTYFTAEQALKAGLIDEII